MKRSRRLLMRPCFQKAPHTPQPRPHLRRSSPHHRHGLHPLLLSFSIQSITLQILYDSSWKNLRSTKNEGSRMATRRECGDERVSPDLTPTVCPCQPIES